MQNMQRKGKDKVMAPTGISKVWTFFRSSFTDRPNPESGSGLTAFKAEWDAMSEKDRADIRKGIDDDSLTY
jgi:hypothetical protein